MIIVTLQLYNYLCHWLELFLVSSKSGMIISVPPICMDITVSLTSLSGVQNAFESLKSATNVTRAYIWRFCKYLSFWFRVQIANYTWRILSTFMSCYWWSYNSTENSAPNGWIGNETLIWVITIADAWSVHYLIKTWRGDRGMQLVKLDNWFKRQYTYLCT